MHHLRKTLLLGAALSLTLPFTLTIGARAASVRRTMLVSASVVAPCIIDGPQVSCAEALHPSVTQRRMAVSPVMPGVVPLADDEWNVIEVSF
jgi:hypothetical protein